MQRISCFLSSCANHLLSFSDQGKCYVTEISPSCSYERFSVLLILSQSALHAASLLDSLGIQVSGNSRAFVYTNKESAFLYGETGRENTTSWQGFNVYGHEFLDDYALLVDGKPLLRSSAIRTAVYPDVLVRYYPSGITEEVRMVDSLPLFSVAVRFVRPASVSLIPYFTDGRSSSEFELSLSPGFALVALRAHRTRTPQSELPSVARNRGGWTPCTRRI